MINDLFHRYQEALQLARQAEESSRSRRSASLSIETTPAASNLLPRALDGERKRSH
jgi:hypothetical protein